MAESFHNTTHASGAELESYELKARFQDEAVAATFRKHAPFPLSPSQVHRSLATHAPLTSIRRAITNLTNAGVLVKTDKQVKGPYGRPEGLWQLRREPEQARLPL